jgi:ABC-2 type transport system permease protein
VTNSVIGHLIVKDWRLNRTLIAILVSVGLLSLVVAQLAAAEPIRLFGSVWFFVSLCILASMLPSTAIVNERKKQTLAFIMSLPVSAVQYAAAKALSIAAMFLVPWAALLASALILIETRHLFAQGVIPTLLILSMLPMVGFCLTAATVLVGESEGWYMAANILCNSSYWFVWYLIARVPALREHWSGPVAVWDPQVLMILLGEIGVCALIIAIAFFFQSRKRDFIH